jgi:hypothetical protein
VGKTRLSAMNWLEASLGGLWDATGPIVNLEFARKTDEAAIPLASQEKRSTGCIHQAENKFFLSRK